MKEEQIVALKEYIKAVVDEKIEMAFGRDALYEAIRRGDAEEVLDRVLSDFND